MIVTELIGGLGNQLFQYAVGRALSLRHGTQLRFDISAFEGNELRTYALHHFSVVGTPLSKEDYRKLQIKGTPRGLLDLLTLSFVRSGQIPVVRERSFEFDAAVLGAPETCYLRGYWQSPKYFEGIEGQLRRELVVRTPIAGKNLVAARHLVQRQAVAVHVRRGDYISNRETHRYHGICDNEYYMSAEELLRKKVGNLEIYVFSDDPDWVQKHLRFQSPTTLVRHNSKEQDYEDLRLMSMCKHHIIANSTFSWWGAWLSKHPGKIVIAPQRWFSEATHSTRDLIPEDWIRL